jgi:predicted Zn-dependent peptidase
MPVNVLLGEVDGVRVLSLDEGDIQGPLQACLVFGVGRADESLPTAGISHVVEHLVLHPTRTSAHSWNGAVSVIATRFYATGRPEDVVDFFAQVSRRLADPPVERLADELRVLQVEASRDTRSQMGLDAGVRFGPRGVGLIDWPEHGLRRLTADEVVDWAHRWFTPQNAALWLSGPIPEGLDLSALPEARPVEREPVSPRALERTFVGENTSTVSFSVLSDDRWGVIPAMTIARQRAFDQLRQRDALSYSVQFTHGRLGGGLALEHLSADGSPESQRQIFDGLQGVLEDLSTAGPTPEEVAELQQNYQQMRAVPQSVLSYLDSSCERCVLGLDMPSREDSERIISAQTPDTLREDLATIMPSLLAIGSEKMDVPPGWTQYNVWSSDVVSGRRFQPINGREDGELVVGPDGVSWIFDEARRRTVHWTDAVASFTWDSGVRAVVGSTGQTVHVTPWHWQGGSDLSYLVDDGIEAARRVRLGEGETQFLRDHDDPASMTDVRWLATITGAACNQQRMDLVIDTDGIFLLFNRAERDAFQERMGELRYEDRESLLSGSYLNRWIPAKDIAEISLSKTRLSRFQAMKATVTILISSSEVVKVHLVNDRQVELAKNGLRGMLGERFQS